MSCGEPHAHDCGEVLAWVTSYLDGELDDAHCADVRQHVEECTPCLKEMGIEQAVKALVARSCGCEEVPESVRMRVVSRIAEIRTQLAAGAGGTVVTVTSTESTIISRG